MPNILKILHFTFLFVFLLELKFASSAKIIFVSPVATKSHKNVFDPLIDELARRGHELTVISPMKSSQLPSKVREIVPLPMEKVQGAMNDPVATRGKGAMGIMTAWNLTHVKWVCDQMYESAEIQELMTSKEDFDLVIANGFMNHCAFGLIGKIRNKNGEKVPLILVTSMPAPKKLAELLGNEFPGSTVPEPYLPLSDRMNFWQRLTNVAVQGILGVFWVHVMAPAMEVAYGKHIPDASSVDEVTEQLSMIFMNSHFTINSPRPLLPSIVEVGGMHCREGKPLENELNDFLSGSGEHGFILFSMGSIIKSENFPEKARKSLLNVFSRLKQRVLWKWDTEMPEKLPPNVKISSWIPQQDVLGLPVFADQDLNLLQAEKFGYCLTLEILDLTEEKLENAINRLLNEKQFAEKAKSLSSIFRDKPQSALETAVFWTEYVLRHNGAPQMQSSAKDLNFFQYHSLDVIAFLVGVFLAISWILKFLIWNLFLCKLISLFRPQKNKLLKSKKIK